jgi:hypothetical protein
MTIRPDLDRREDRHPALRAPRVAHAPAAVPGAAVLFAVEVDAGWIAAR